MGYQRIFPVVSDIKLVASDIKLVASDIELVASDFKPVVLDIKLVVPDINQISSNSDNSSASDSSMYISPRLQDLLLIDVNDDVNKALSREVGVDYLGPASEHPGIFPVSGEIFGPNKRLMVNLVCRRRSGINAPIVNVMWLVDTGSPVSYISETAMNALLGDCESSQPYLKIFIQSRTSVECHMSPKDKHFPQVNVLGMDFLSRNRLSIEIDYNEDKFLLYEAHGQ